MSNWKDNEALEWNDVNGFIESACNVLATVETIDFGLVENGKDLKKEITSSAIAIICKGFSSILSIK